MVKIIKEAFCEFRKNRKMKYALLLLLAGIILVIISSSFSGSDNEAKRESIDEYREKLESRVADLCSSVDGVGKCRVFITFERGEQNTYKGSTLIESKPPAVLGVSVVCRGADSERVKRELTEMLSALFDIGYNRISILKLN